MGSGKSPVDPFRRRLQGSLVTLLTGSLQGGGHAELARLLRAALESLGRESLPALLRNLDRAWRCFPGEALIVAPLYARALMLEASDYEAVLSVAQQSIASVPDPDIAATRVLALLHLSRTTEALDHLESALTEYCVRDDDVLACAADEVLEHPSVDAPGWIGMGPTLQPLTRLAQPKDARDLVVRIADGQRLAHRRGIRLLGSGARTPADFLLDGRAVNRGRRVTAWARLGSLPGTPPCLRFADHGQRHIEVQSVRPAEPGWRWAATVNLDASRLYGDCIEVSTRLPNGKWQALPDAPLLLRPMALRRPRARPSTAKKTWPTSLERRHIDVVIPIYGNREESLACIESALQSTSGFARLVVVDDASEDRLLKLSLEKLASEGKITLLRNAQNLGFSGAVNRGLSFDSARDVVLLNSDTLVFHDWLMRLQAAAYSHPSIGTVTPLSNNGSIASYPHASGAVAPSPAAAAKLHALAASTNAGRRIVIPVGVGFCLYLRRDCLNAVGNLDAAVFGKGYGEETDFCLRARALGWTHRLATDVYVSHAGGMSFGTRRAALLDRSQRLLNLRHPGFHRSVMRFLARDPAHGARRNLDSQRLRSHVGRNVLLVTLALGGGVDRFVKHRCRELQALGLTPILLRPVKPQDRSRCELWAEGLELPNLQFRIPDELPDLNALLRTIPFESTEIQHFLHLDARVIDLVRSLSAPYDVFVHDYAWLCPRVTLIDGRGYYCGEPAIEVCETCVKRHGSHLGEKLSVEALRARSARWLRAARRVIAPSEDTAARLTKNFRGLDVEVRPHAAPPLPARREGRHTPVQGAKQPTLRVALIGAIGEHKGYRVLLNCARDARKRQLPVEFVVIGYTVDDAPLLATGKVFITGPYIDGEAPHLIKRERPDVAWLPSVWPETWCYALDYALGARLPVVAFDLGAIAERLRSIPGAKLLPLTMKSQRINDRILDFRNASFMRLPRH